MQTIIQLDVLGKIHYNKTAMKKPSIFNSSDRKQINLLGLTESGVEKQLDKYQRGANYLHLNRPCQVPDGIVSVSPRQRKKLIALFEEQVGKCKILKFVPASGAASRMFTAWFSIREQSGFSATALERKFFRNLCKYPFFPLVTGNKTGKKLLAQKDAKNLLEFVLSTGPLQYGNCPKALIPFHCYPHGELRTPLEEHLYEAAKYIRNASNVCHLHFTVSEEHLKSMKKYLQTILTKYEKHNRVKYKITFSVQSQATNTLAVDENNRPLRDDNGRLIFRPGGHGALLQNLNNIDADFIFVRNIDNVAPERLLQKNLPYKKLLGGLALQNRNEIFSHLRQLESRKINEEQIERIAAFCRSTLNMSFPPRFTQLSEQEKISVLFSLLHRPLRICGMVHNEGEPGGGPFWVDEQNGAQTLQIIESGHVDKNDSQQLNIWSQAEYFNPVDLVCCIKNHRGEKYNLADFVNQDAFLITQKSEKGRKLKALELPGLWNGGMAYWNTIFVELPIIVFNPVKAVDDLLRPQHLRTV